MGAQFEHRIINKSKATREELGKIWNQIVSECLYESGHGGYSGTLKECSGMQVVNLHFPNVNEAYEWVSGNTQKREAAKCVSFDDIEEKVTQEITFNGKPRCKLPTSGQLVLRYREPEWVRLRRSTHRSTKENAET